MMLRVSNPAGVGEEAPHADLSGAGAVKASPPADFVHDNGQILLELLRGRAAEEERRRFVTGLRRLRDGRRTRDDL